MTLAVEIIVSALLVLGGIFGLIGSYGLIKLRDGMQRLHAPTKASTVGVGAALIASSLYAWLTRGDISLQEVLILVFLFLTAPVTALFLAKVHLHLAIKRKDLPETGVGRDWATFDSGESGQK